MYIPMPAGVRIPQRIVQRVRVAVEGLGRGRVGDEGVGLGEAAEQRVVPAGAVEIEPQRLLVILTGVAFGCQGAERAAAVVAIGQIILLALHRPRLVHEDRGRAQMIGQHIEYPVIAAVSSPAQGQGR